MISTNKGNLLSAVQSLWSAEAMLVKTLPGIIEKASNLGLNRTLAYHFAETLQHKTALEAVCKQLGIPPQGEENMAMKGILEEGEQAMANQDSGNSLDAAIIATAKKIEHYEINSYPLAAGYAAALGYEGIAARLNFTFEEERQAETKLKFLEKALLASGAEIGEMSLVD